MAYQKSHSRQLCRCCCVAAMLEFLVHSLSPSRYLPVSHFFELELRGQKLCFFKNGRIFVTSVFRSKSVFPCMNLQLDYCSLALLYVVVVILVVFVVILVAFVVILVGVVLVSSVVVSFVVVVIFGVV